MQRVDVGADGVHRMRREVDAARVLDAVEQHRLAGISRTNTQIRHLIQGTEQKRLKKLKVEV